MLVKEINAVFLWLPTGRNQNSNSVGKHSFSKVGMHPFFYDLFFCQFWHSLASVAELIQEVQCQKWERRHQLVNTEYADSIWMHMASVKSDRSLEIIASFYTKSLWKCFWFKSAFFTQETGIYVLPAACVFDLHYFYFASHRSIQVLSPVPLLLIVAKLGDSYCAQKTNEPLTCHLGDKNS